MQFFYHRYPVGMPVVFDVAEADLERLELGAPTSDVSHMTVLVFDPMLETAPPVPGAFGNRFRDLTLGWLENADLIVLRGSGTDFVPTISSDLAFQEEFREKVKPVVALVSRRGQDHVAPGFERLAGIIPFNLAGLLPTVREAEIVSLLRLSGAVLEAGDPYHFVLPAGPHTPKFLRIADALQDLASVRRIAEWILPHLSSNSAILADTRSLTSLLLQIQGMMREDGQDSGSPISIDSFPAYPRDRQDFGNTVAEFELRNPGKEVIFLLSVNSSGTLLSQMKERAADRGGGVVVVCDTRCEEDPGDVVVLSRMPIERWNPGSNGKCPKCDDFLNILIHPSSFERIGNPRFEPVPVNLDPIRENEWFWESAEATDAVRLHYRAPYGNGFDRHFAIYVDVAKLLSAAEFRSRCLEALSTLPRPKIVLITEHAAADAIRSLIDQRFAEGWGESSDVPSVHVLPTTADLEPLLGELKGDEWVLIADDALVAGTTLRTWRQKIHAITRSREDVINLAGFVALARPHSKDAMRSVRNLYIENKDGKGELHLKWGACVYMPAPDIDDCPWCTEYRILNWFGNKLQGVAKDFADRRLDQLRTGDLRVPLMTDPDLEKSGMNLHTEGSFFGRLRPVTAMAAATCAAHALSVSLGESLNRGVVQQVDTAHFIGSFFENVFHAGVLRTVPRRQIFSPELETRLSQELAQWPQLARDQGFTEIAGFLAEFGWAAVNGKLPRVSVLELIDEVQGSYPALELMRQLIELNIVQTTDR